jgi:hypothetical protein
MPASLATRYFKAGRVGAGFLGGDKSEARNPKSEKPFRPVIREHVPQPTEGTRLFGFRASDFTHLIPPLVES